MVIQALPQSTVRAIGANQALTDPCALVKELVDNALDARATSIAVEIHANTLDSIQVRDNGHGIPPQDRALVARRYCTSKITGFDDLKSIGGSSLGFRGEALASTAELSGGLMVTTRVEGEQMATALKIDQQGEVVGQERASSPVGTTVKVTGFSKSNPVRTQVMLKHADQCLKKIKHQLQSFAFARPNARISLRVLKAKNDKGNWTYAPKTGGNAEDAAFKIVGAACASQCQWSVVEAHGHTLQAFLPRPDAIDSKISSIGCFVSVDGRPLTTSRSISRDIVKIFRKSLKTANHDLESVNDPFMYLAIECPDESYDANIEPAKDDVLFEDAEKVIDAVKQLFSAVYPQPSAVPIEITTLSDVPEELLMEQSLSCDDDFTAALEGYRPGQTIRVDERTDQPRRPRNATGDQEETSVEKNSAHASSQRRPPGGFRSNMYGCDDEDFDQLDSRPQIETTGDDLDEMRQAHNDKSVSNPWVIAKMNAVVRMQDATELPASPEHLSNGNAEPRRPNTPTQPSKFTTPGLPTPRLSSPSDDNQPFHPSNHVQNARLRNDGRMIERPPVPAAPQYSAASPFQDNIDNRSFHGPNYTPSRPEYSFNVRQPSEEPHSIPLRAIPQVKPRRQAQPNRPFVSPVVDGPPREKVWFDHIEGIEQRRKRRQNNEYRAPEGPVAQGKLGDFANEARVLTPPRRNRDIREFVDPTDLTMDDNASSTTRPANSARHHRTATESVQQLPSEGPDENAISIYGGLSARGFVPASELAAVEARLGTVEKPAPPPKRRKTGDRALLQINCNVPPPLPHLSDEDAEYMPAKTSDVVTRHKSSSKVHRSKLSRLPLERVPAGKGTHSFAVKINVSDASIAAMERRMDRYASILPWNEPALEAYDTFGQQKNPHEVQAMAQKLHELLVNRVSDGEMIQDLGQLVQDAIQCNAERRASGAMEESETGSTLAPTQTTQDD